MRSVFQRLLASVAIFATLLAAHGGTRSSPSYQVVADAIASGGGRASAGVYSNQASIGLITGTSAAAGVTATGGFAAQLNESDATLSGLTINAAGLTPPFAAGTFSYAVSVANAVSSVTVTATTTRSSATLKINGQAAAS